MRQLDSMHATDMAKLDVDDLDCQLQANKSFDKSVAKSVEYALVHCSVLTHICSFVELNSHVIKYFQERGREKKAKVQRYHSISCNSFPKKVHILLSHKFMY